VIDPRVYKSFSDAEIEAAIKALQDERSLRRGVEPIPSAAKIRDLFDATSSNFMGTGMTMTELMLSERLKAFRNSLGEQSREERRRRLDYVIKLSVELAKIQEVGPFATRLAEGAIGDLIQGEWANVKIMAGHFRFEEESEDLRSRYAPLYVEFVRLLEEAFATRPGTEPQPTVTH
jgi:hypothetical protein